MLAGRKELSGCKNESRIARLWKKKCTVKVKQGKAIPLQAWTVPDGSRRLRLPDFKTIGTRRW